VQFLWYDTIDMQGGRILGEGVDGCIFEGPMWPCAEGAPGSESAPDTMDRRYVSKLVSKKDEEAGFLRMAERLLGHELADKYISRLQTECEPATQNNPPKQKNLQSFKKGQENTMGWTEENQACGELKGKLKSGQNISHDSKLMIIKKYPDTVSNWVEKLKTTNFAYSKIMHYVENAIPNFIFILQKLYQNPAEQLIHIDLHTGNIIVKYKPLEFGIADFGRCVFRRQNDDPSKTFFGDFLIKYVSGVAFLPRFTQVPLEARILSYCYMQKLDNVSPAVLVNSWASDKDVREMGDSTDVIISERSNLVSTLLNKRLFIEMIESIQSICKKLRINLNDPSALYNSLSSTERMAVEFILTRYSILSPINTIHTDIMNIYPYTLYKQGTRIKRFLQKAIMLPYLQEGSSLDKVLTLVQAADLRILWADVVSGKII
jgi:hypothetical protein